MVWPKGLGPPKFGSIPKQWGDSPHMETLEEPSRGVSDFD